MIIWQSLLVTASTLFLFVLPCQASGPCSKDIVQMRSKIDARLGAIAAAAPSVAVTSGAKLHRQPSTESMAKVLSERGLLSPGTVEQIKGAMTRSRTANAAGDKAACEQALAEAERALPP
jgi:hypothetical protein